MCGIVGIFKIKQQTQELRQKALKMSQKLRHRGPDWNGIYVGGSTILAHERLSIVDPQSGGQPLYSPDRKQILAVNGEIYSNPRERIARYNAAFPLSIVGVSMHVKPLCLYIRFGKFAAFLCAKHIHINFIEVIQYNGSVFSP